MTLGETADGDMYAGRNGDVYKKTEGGWQQYDPDAGNWSSATAGEQAAQRSSERRTDEPGSKREQAARPAPDYSQLNRDSRARSQGMARFQQRRARGGRGGGRRR